MVLFNSLSYLYISYTKKSHLTRHIRRCHTTEDQDNKLNSLYRPIACNSDTNETKMNQGTINYTHTENKGSNTLYFSPLPFSRRSSPCNAATSYITASPYISSSSRRSTTSTDDEDEDEQVLDQFAYHHSSTPHHNYWSTPHYLCYDSQIVNGSSSTTTTTTVPTLYHQSTRHRAGYI